MNDDHLLRAENPSASRADAGERWFAIRIRSGCEKTIVAIAENKGYSIFHPTYPCRRRFSDRFKIVDVPLFPGYAFCYLNPQFRLPVLTIPGVLHFVGLGRLPLPIENEEIEAIQAAVRSGLRTEPCGYLAAGVRVRVQQGPLSGVEGLLIEAKKRHRVIVSITMLKRSVSVEVEQDWLQSIDPPRSLFPVHFATDICS